MNTKARQTMLSVEITSVQINKTAAAIKLSEKWNKIIHECIEYGVYVKHYGGGKLYRNKLKEVHSTKDKTSDWDALNFCHLAARKLLNDLLYRGKQDIYE